MNVEALREGARKIREEDDSFKHVALVAGLNGKEEVAWSALCWLDEKLPEGGLTEEEFNVLFNLFDSKHLIRATGKIVRAVSVGMLDPTQEEIVDILKELQNELGSFEK